MNKLYTVLFTMMSVVNQTTWAFKSITKPQVKSFDFYILQPTGFFDPLRVTENSNEKTLQYYGFR